MKYSIGYHCQGKQMFVFERKKTTGRNIKPFRCFQKQIHFKMETIRQNELIVVHFKRPNTSRTITGQKTNPN